MGMNIDTLRFLLAARGEWKVDFGRSLMLGKQDIIVPPHEVSALLMERALLQTCRAREITADQFFHCLGASEVQAMDFSDYEGAELLHD